jgi:hypothetical protein
MLLVCESPLPGRFLVNGWTKTFLKYVATVDNTYNPVYRTSISYTAAQCRGCPQKHNCTSAPFRSLVIHWHEQAREVVRGLADTPPYIHSQRARRKIEAMLSELKHRVGLRRVRLRRTWNVAEQFLMAATAQNLKRLVRFLEQRQPLKPSTA